MKLHSINTSFNSNYKTNFKQDQAEKAPVKKTGLFEKFHEKTKNSADMTDTIVVPRTIFKGYLGIMAGTTLITAGSLLGKTLAKTSKALSFAGLAASLYGTYAFVRPFIIKDAPGVETKKEEV
ncbi:MAG: hypothetical protein V8R83_11230 [Candidatus Gastranaerophilaceae bacterium]|jgi:hypothetical protein|nr:hypothetical protein [Clostridium sp.]